MECSHQFLLYISAMFALFTGRVYADCRALDDSIIFAEVSADFHTEQRPSISTVFNTFFTNSVLQDRCISKHVLEATQSTSSSATVSPSHEYVRTYYNSDGSSKVVTGSLSLESGKPYISWNGHSDAGVLQTGRMYILDIQPHQEDPDHAWNPSQAAASVITFYTCSDGVGEKKEAIFIVQTPGAKESHLDAAKQYLETLNLPSELKQISCY